MKTSNSFKSRCNIYVFSTTIDNYDGNETGQEYVDDLLNCGNNKYPYSQPALYATRNLQPITKLAI